MNTIEGPHCQSCGSTSPEDVSNLADTDGYSRCCNQRVVSPFAQRFDFRLARTVEEPTTCEAFGDCYHD